ncbi:MAG: NAD(P)H-dependent oxidoreductase [Bacillota bacterium]|jgi:predicted homoserine dehydrogenase-like protein
MHIIDTALEKRAKENKPIRVALIGTGFMGSGIAYQILNFVPGIKLVAMANRNLAKARQAYEMAKADNIVAVKTAGELENAARKGIYAITEDGLLLCRAENIDAILEVTGSVEYGAEIALEAIKNGKHIITMNAELGATIGPLLNLYAEKAGVIYTDTDGDQPGVIMNLLRFVKGIGAKPVLAGNIKGLHDPYRNPDTQKEFAAKWNQKPHMVTSFADGSKISFEQAIVANASGMRVAKRGMYGFRVPPGTHIQEAVELFPKDQLLSGPGIVDYLVGASPAPGVFVLATYDHPVQQRYLELYKMGKGPFYCFYTPYHLCHFEVTNTIARVVIFGDSTIKPAGPPQVGVVATAKKDLKAGDILDGIGYYMTYGQCENWDVITRERLLALGLAQGCRLKTDIPKDKVLTMNDVDFPPHRLIDRLYREQLTVFSHN